MDTSKFLLEAKRLGYKAVELLSYWTNTPEQIKQVLKETKDLGLKVSSFGASNDFALTGAELEPQVASVKKAIAAAVEFGAPIVRVFSANVKPGLDFDKALGMIVNGFKQVAPDAEAAKVTLALENHGKLACRSEHVAAIIKNVGSPALKSTFDVGNFLIADEDPIHAATVLAKDVAHVHVKDHRWDGVEGEPPQVYVSIAGKKLWPEVIGEGQIDFVKIFKILKKAGFKGYLSLEYEGNDPEPEGVYTSSQNLFKLAAQA